MVISETERDTAQSKVQRNVIYSNANNNNNDGFSVAKAGVQLFCYSMTKTKQRHPVTWVLKCVTVKCLKPCGTWVLGNI